MLRKGPTQSRPQFGPQPRDFLSAPVPERTSSGERAPDEPPSGGVPSAVEAKQEQTGKVLLNVGLAGASRQPDPRIPGKHALNPPIVTIFGAGIAGLTAAHELVDRGFVVQVVESADDPYCPGRPLVGGMAANQPARVRANVEDLHRELMVKALTPTSPKEPAQVTAERAVAGWLLRLFAFNRSRWIQTEDPVSINGCIFSRKDAKEGEQFRTNLFVALRAAYDRYRSRWLWDLTVRGVLLGAILPQDLRVNAVSNAMQVAATLGKMKTNFEIATALLGYRLAADRVGLPSEDDLKACEPMVTAAMNREFLCFRLLPNAREGFPEATQKAQELYNEWLTVFKTDPVLSSCCVSVPTEKDESGIQRARDGMPVSIGTASTDPACPYIAWLQVDIIEQRLPGEHGYRFFPSFYRHLDDTMERIPLYFDGVPTGRSVQNNLIPTLFQGIGLSALDKQQAMAAGHDLSGDSTNYDPKRQRLAQLSAEFRTADSRYPEFGDPVSEDCRPKKGEASVIALDRERPKSIEDFRNASDRFVERLGGSKRDAVVLLARLMRYLMASPERRRKEYELLNWAEFLRIQDFSAPMQFQIQSAAQALLGFSAAEADAHTYGNVAIQMLLDQLRDGSRVDRTLNGPTSDAWLEPWREHLERQGVRFFRGRIDGLEFDPTLGEVVPKLNILEKDQVSGQAARLLTHKAPDAALQPDFYILALNYEQTRRVIASLQRAKASMPAELVKESGDFDAAVEFERATRETNAFKNMTGIQYFFDAKTDIGRGHMYFPYSDWGLSSITQSEFWSARGGYADGYFGVLSVDVCTTEDLKKGTVAVPDPSGAPASAPGRTGTFMGTLDPDASGDRDERRFKVARTVLNQIQNRLTTADRLSAPRCFHIDRNLTVPEGDRARFLASMVGLDRARPGRRAGECVGPQEIEYKVAYKRWVVCGTFMATHTRMTTMESANESARHAVAAILRKLSENDASPEKIRADYHHNQYQIENLVNRTYNWASVFRKYETPETFNPEDDELADLDFFRRVDRRLMDLGLPHFMDIINFDKKLLHALDAIDIYGEERPLSELFGAASAGLDATLTRELGQGYSALEQARWRQAQTLGSSAVFTDMNRLNDRWKELLDVFSNLIRAPRTATTGTIGGDLFRRA